jgi:hypothetical protein
MNKIQPALTAFLFAASFMVFGVAHAQVGESSGVPYLESKSNSGGDLLVFATVPANTLRVIKMIDCTTTLLAGTLVWERLVVTGAIFDFPAVSTFPLQGGQLQGGHQANSNNNVLVLFLLGATRLYQYPTRKQPLLYLTNVR